MFLFKPVTKELNVFVIRHGESEANVDVSKYRSMTDRLVKLSELGNKQAKLTGVFLNSHFTFNNKNSLLFSSTYTRAQQTAENINLSTKLILRQDDRIVEHNHGIFNGLTKKEKFQKFPTEAKYFYKQKKMGNEFFTSTPMGESPADIAIRFHSFWIDIERYFLEKNPSIDNIIIVSHGTTNLVIQKTFMDYNIDWYEKQSNPLNCSIMHFTIHQNSDHITDHGFIFTPNIS